MVKPYLIELNTEDNEGRVMINMNNVTHYELAVDRPNGATRIFFTSGEQIIVADMVGQIDVLLGWKEEGKIDFAGKFSKVD